VRRPDAALCPLDSHQRAPIRSPGPRGRAPSLRWRPHPPSNWESLSRLSSGMRAFPTTFTADRYKERLLDMDVGDAGDLLEEVALKGIASLRIQQRQAEKLRRYLLGRRGWEDAAAVLASFGRLSLDDTSPGVAAGDQAAGGAASASALDGMDVDGGYASAEEDAGPASGWPAAASGSKKGPGCSHSGAGTSAAAEGSEGAVAGSAGCGGTRTPEAESGAREARAAVVAGGGGPAVSVDTSDSTPPAEGGEGGCPRSLLDPGRAHVCVTAGISSPEALPRGRPALRLFLLLCGHGIRRWAGRLLRRSRRRRSRPSTGH